MFFKSYLFYIFLKFLWAGLIWGLVQISCKIFDRLLKENLFTHNIISFLFWVGFGFCYVWLCSIYYNHAFCWFGLFGMVTGLMLVKISLNFFFTNLLIMLYNKLVLIKNRKKVNGKFKKFS